MIIFTLVSWHIVVIAYFIYNFYIYFIFNYFTHYFYYIYIFFFNSNSVIMNKKSQLAWDLYLKMDTTTESFNLLQLIANDCYKVGEFWYAAKAFDVLERMDPSPENWEGKRGACCGVFQYIVAERQSKCVSFYLSINAINSLRRIFLENYYLKLYNF